MWAYILGGYVLIFFIALYFWLKHAPFGSQDSGMFVKDEDEKQT